MLWWDRGGRGRERGTGRGRRGGAGKSSIMCCGGIRERGEEGGGEGEEGELGSLV